MSNLGDLTNIPGVIHRVFCTFCSGEAMGDITIQEDGGMKIPVCEVCRDKVLDKGLAAMLN